MRRTQTPGRSDVRGRRRPTKDRIRDTALSESSQYPWQLASDVAVRRRPASCALYIHLALCVLSAKAKSAVSVMADFGPVIDEVSDASPRKISARLRCTTTCCDGSHQQLNLTTVATFFNAVVCVASSGSELLSTACIGAHAGCRGGGTCRTFGGVIRRDRCAPFGIGGSTAGGGGRCCRSDEATQLSNNIQEAEDALFALAADLGTRCALQTPSAHRSIRMKPGCARRRLRELRKRLCRMIAPPATGLVVQLLPARTSRLLARDTCCVAAAALWPTRATNW